MSIRCIVSQAQLLNLLSLTVALLWAIPAVQAAPVSVTNAGFELPGTVKTEYWDATGAIVPGIIPGWEPSGPGNPANMGGPVAGPGDSGVEGGGASGAWQGFLNSADPSIYNTTGHAVEAGMNYTLTLASRNIFSNGVSAASLLMTLYYDDAGTRVSMASTTALVMPEFGGFADYSLTLPAASVPAAAVGKPIGIELDNITDTASGITNSWVALDDVRLDSVVPEPTAAMLLGLGAMLVGLVARRQR